MNPSYDLLVTTYKEAQQSTPFKFKTESGNKIGKHAKKSRRFAYIDSHLPQVKA